MTAPKSATFATKIAESRIRPCSPMRGGRKQRDYPFRVSSPQLREKSYMLPSLRWRVSWCLRWSLVLNTCRQYRHVRCSSSVLQASSWVILAVIVSHTFWHLLHVRLAKSVPRHWLVWRSWASCRFLGGWPVLGSFHPHRGHFQSRLSSESWACLLEQLPS